MMELKLDAETKLLAALGMYEHLSDAQYWRITPSAPRPLARPCSSC